MISLLHISSKFSNELNFIASLNHKSYDILIGLSFNENGNNRMTVDFKTKKNYQTKPHREVNIFGSFQVTYLNI